MQGIKGVAIYLSFGGLIILGVFSYNTLGKGRAGEKIINTVKVGPADADLRLNKIDYTQTRGAIKQWKVEAEGASYFRERNLVLFKKIKVTCFSEGGGRIILGGEEGEFNTDTQIIHLQGQVIITSEDGYQFRTDSLNFSPLENKIFTLAEIKLAGPKLEVRGQGLMLSLADKTFRVNRVRSLIQDFNLNEARIK